MISPNIYIISIIYAIKSEKILKYSFVHYFTFNLFKILLDIDIYYSLFFYL